VREGNCSEDCLAEEDAEVKDGGKRVERSELKEEIAEDAETEIAMGTKGDARVCLCWRRENVDEVCLDTELSVRNETTEKEEEISKENKSKEQTDSPRSNPSCCFDLTRTLPIFQLSFPFPLFFFFFFYKCYS